MYGLKAGSENLDGISIPSLAPGIYKDYELKEVKFDNTTKGDGTKGKQIITFLFDGPQGSHQHTEYEVDPNDAKAESKGANLFKRVGHIMSKYVDKNLILSQKFTDFATLGNWVVNTLNPVKTGVKVEIKVMGNVYNGEARAAFPGYPPFIARPGHAEYKSLAMTANENAENKKYHDHLNATPDTEQSTATSTSGGQAIDSDF